MDTADPVVALERTEFVRTDDSYSILARLVRATQVDTVVHAGLVVDSALVTGPAAAREERHRDHEPARRRWAPRTAG